jgi:hypothetical protein
MAATGSNDVDANKLTVVVLGPGTTTAATAVSATKPPPLSARHVQWLRAAVLGASDGLVSTAALMLGRVPGGRAGLRAVVGGLVAMGITYGLMKLSRIHGV